MRKLYRHATIVAVAATTLTAAGCTTIRETKPSQTAREQLMLSKAADLASAKIKPNLPAGDAIYVDTSYFSAGSEYRGKYAVARIRSQLLSDGYRLVGSAGKADTIAEISAGALSIDESNTLFGIPSITVPIPLSGPVSTPQIGFFKRGVRTGVAKFDVSFYDAKTGTLEDSVGPVYGFSHYNRSSLLGIGWKNSNLLPPKARAEMRGDKAQSASGSSS